MSPISSYYSMQSRLISRNRFFLIFSIGPISFSDEILRWISCAQLFKFILLIFFFFFWRKLKIFFFSSVENKIKILKYWCGHKIGGYNFFTMAICLRSYSTGREEGRWSKSCARGQRGLSLWITVTGLEIVKITYLIRFFLLKRFDFNAGIILY